MSGLVIVLVVLVIIWGAGTYRQPRRTARQATPASASATDAEAWRALVRPMRFTAPVAYGALGAAIRDCVRNGTGGVGSQPALAQRALDSQTTTFVYGTLGGPSFIATLVCEPDGTGSRGRLEVSVSIDQAADLVQRRTLRQLRTQVAHGVSRVAGQVRDA